MQLPCVRLIADTLTFECMIYDNNSSQTTHTFISELVYCAHIEANNEGWSLEIPFGIWGHTRK